jgi:uncharacterized protein (DUF433 family)
MGKTVILNSSPPTELRPLASSDPRLAWPLYTVSEAARYLKLSTSTVHSWAYPSSHAEALVTTVRGRGWASVPFIGFAEAFVIKAAKTAGVPDHRIRPGVDAIKERAGGIPHALASRLVWTDGAELLFAAVEDDDLEVADTSQRQFRRVVEDQLKLIAWADDGFAARLRLPQFPHASVTVDPKVASGRPLLQRGAGVRIKDLIDSVRAGDSPSDVARGFGVPLEEVQEVIGNA